MEKEHHSIILRWHLNLFLETLDISQKWGSIIHVHSFLIKIWITTIQHFTYLIIFYILILVFNRPPYFDFCKGAMLPFITAILRLLKWKFWKFLLGYTLEQPQAVGIIGIVGIVAILGIVGISLLTKGHAINSFMGLVVIIEAHDNLRKFYIL